MLRLRRGPSSWVASIALATTALAAGCSDRCDPIKLRAPNAITAKGKGADAKTALTIRATVESASGQPLSGVAIGFDLLANKGDVSRPLNAFERSSNGNGEVVWHLDEDVFGTPTGSEQAQRARFVHVETGLRTLPLRSNDPLTTPCKQEVFIPFSYTP